MSRHFYLFLTIALSIVAHIRWFVPGIYTYGDWWHTTRETALEWISFGVIGPWKSSIGFGDFDPQLYFAPFNFVRGFFALLPYGEYWGLFFVYFLPIIILAPLGIFLLIRRFVPDDRAAFIGSVFYIFSTSFLTLQTAHLTIALAYAYAPFMILGVAEFFLQKNNTNIRTTIVTAFLISLGIIIEPRIFYVLIIIFLPCIFFMRGKLRSIVLLGVFVLLFNAYWLIPFCLSGTGNSVSELIDRPLFGNGERSMQHALTSVQPAWSWYAPKPFEIQPIYPYFWIFSFVVFLGLWYVPKLNKSAKLLTIWAYVIAIVGIFLAKQSHDPFPEFYGWLFEYFPGFSLFRESSKFFILINISFAYLIAFSTFAALRSSVNKSKAWVGVHVFLIGSVLFFSILNTLPLLTGQIDTMFVRRMIDQDYKSLEKQVFAKKDFSRILGIPQFPRWMSYSTTHPKVDLNHFKKIYEQNRSDAKNSTAFLEDLTTSSAGIHMLNAASVKYIFVPPLESRNNDYFFASKESGEDGLVRSKLIATLDASTQFKKIIGENEGSIVAYENPTSRPYFNIFTHSCDVEKVTIGDDDGHCIKKDAMINMDYLSPMRKVVHFSEISDSFYLTMSERFDDNWIIRKVSSDVVVEKHFAYLSHFNGWQINRLTHCDREDACSIKITIEHKAYRMFIVGIVISFCTLIILSGIAGHDYFLRRKRHGR